MTIRSVRELGFLTSSVKPRLVSLFFTTVPLVTALGAGARQVDGPARSGASGTGWWLAVLVAMALAAGVYAAIRLRLRRHEHRERELEQAVADRTEELAAANRKLEEANRRLHDANQQLQERMAFEAKIQHAQKLESLEELAGGIAHEFNNLLVGVLGNAHLALRLVEEQPELRHFLDDIREAGERAADLSKHMLAFSGKGRFIVEPVDLSRVIDEMKSLVRVSVSRKTRLLFELDEGVPMVDADVNQIAQVLMNLVANAAEAIGEEDGTLTVTTGAVELVRPAELVASPGADLEPGSYVFFEVADDGCGMDEETRARIFDPFFTTKSLGRGLGLAAVQGIVRGHHGAIRLWTEPGRGTTLRVLFPPSESVYSTATVLKDAVDEKWRGNGTVLVIDDEKTVRMVTRRMLEGLGFRILEARDGKEGLDVFDRHAGELHLVILDIAMPKMSGEETLGELRRRSSEVPVVLMSGFSERDVAARFAGESIAGFLAKPFSETELVTVVQQALEAS